MKTVKLLSMCECLFYHNVWQRGLVETRQCRAESHEQLYKIKGNRKETKWMDGGDGQRIESFCKKEMIPREVTRQLTTTKKIGEFVEFLSGTTATALSETSSSCKLTYNSYRSPQSQSENIRKNRTVACRLTVESSGIRPSNTTWKDYRNQKQLGNEQCSVSLRTSNIPVITRRCPKLNEPEKYTYLRQVDDKKRKQEET